MRQESKSNMKNIQKTNQLTQDILMLLNHIRSRQNTLIAFRQHFGNSQQLCCNQYISYKNDFLQKQILYSKNALHVVNKYESQKAGNSVIKSFWIKLKSILKLSLQRLQMLALMNQPLYQRFQTIIQFINNCYNQDKGLKHFKSLEILLKKRNLQLLLFRRDSGSIPTNRSQMFIKRFNSHIEKTPLAQQRQLQPRRPIQIKGQSKNTIKSINKNRQLKRKHTIMKEDKKQYKGYLRIAKQIIGIEKSIQGSMQAKLQINMDKKKTILQNANLIYDTLYRKNIPNHKLIMKYLFTSSNLNPNTEIKHHVDNFRFKQGPRKIAKKVKPFPEEIQQTLQLNRVGYKKKTNFRPKTGKLIYSMKFSQSPIIHTRPI